MTARRDSGIALFAAIWMVAILSVLAIGVSRESRTALSIAGNELDAARAEHAAEAGIARLRALLVASARGEALPDRAAEPLSDTAPPRLPDGSRGLRLDGHRYGWRFAGVDLALSITAERGKLDLIRGDEALLAALFAHLGIGDAREAQAVVAARRQDGRISRLIDVPRIRDLAALGHITGFTPGDIDRLAPFVTLDGGAAMPDPVTAPDRLWGLLPLADDERRLVHSLRIRPVDLSARDLPERFTLTVHATGPGGVTVVRRAMVELDPRHSDPVRIIRR